MAPPVIAQSVFRHPLTAALAGEGAVRLLRELAGHGGPLSPRALADRTGLTVQGARRALKRLEAVGVAVAVGSVDRRLYQLNPAHPLAPALAALFAAEAARVDAVYDGVRAALAGAPLPVLAAWTYGSVARGEDTAVSDLDVAVVFDVADAAERASRRAAGPADDRRDAGANTSVEAAVGALREALAPLEQTQHVTLSLVGLSRDDVRRLGAGDPWWAGAARDAVPLAGPAPSALAARLRAADAVEGRAPGRGRRAAATAHRDRPVGRRP